MTQREIAELLRAPGGAYFAEGTPAMLALETMIDTVGLSNTLYALASLCSDKAEHIRSNWQDETLAKHWDKRNNALTLIAGKYPMRNT
jgi:hypothetical protein